MGLAAFTGTLEVSSCPVPVPSLSLCFFCTRLAEEDEVEDEVKGEEDEEDEEDEDLEVVEVVLRTRPISVKTRRLVGSIRRSA